MSKIKLFIACSIDGYIARKNGALDWLPGSDPNNQQELEDLGDGGYTKFINYVDVILMGNSTYQEVLGFGVDWPYNGLKCYVLTNNPNLEIKTADTQLLTELDLKSIERLRDESKKGVWVVGGGKVISQFLNFDAVDEMTVNVVSIILGDGIKLFPNQPKETQFELIETEQFGKKLVNLKYRAFRKT
ncbi:MAG: dihydrofolate reductase family protein [Bacteroidetes bacterium]|nr:dihydrofolate reductase family protein [Bacteroidota bacterium]